MRKKLLALLMCATMVLGTGVTAMASTADDAKKIGKENAEKFIAEYYPEDSVIKGDAYNGTNGTVEYGYKAGDASANVLGDYVPVVIYKDGDNYYEATKVAGEGKLVGYELKAVASSTTAADTLLKAAGIDVTKVDVFYGLNGTKVDPNKKVDITTPVASSSTTYYDKDANAILTTTDGTVTAVDTVEKAARLGTGVASGALADDTAVTVWDDNHGSSQVVVVQKHNSDVTQATVVPTKGYVTNTKNYVKLDNKGVLVKGSKNILNSTDENGFGTIYASMAGAGDKFETNAVISALNSKVFTKDAVAVKITAYLQTPVANFDLGLENKNIFNGNAKELKNLTKLQEGKYTFDSDLITRTGFKGAEAVDVFQPTLAATKFDEEAGALVKDFVKVATVTVGDTITFENGASYVDGFFVFDKGTVEEKPSTDANDGVSDTTATTTPATDNAASPKTGDVAPIAALAVVMMGAFGAMVVASKKRA